MELTNIRSQGFKLEVRLDNVKVLMIEDCVDVGNEVFSKVSKLRKLYFESPRLNRGQELFEAATRTTTCRNLTRILKNSRETLKQLEISDYVKEVIVDTQMKNLTHVTLAYCSAVFTSSLIHNSATSLTHLDLFCVESDFTVITNLETLQHVSVSQCSAGLVKSIIEAGAASVTHIDLTDIISDITINTDLVSMTHLVII